MERAITVSRQHNIVFVTLQPNDTLCMSFDEHSAGPVNYMRIQINTGLPMNIFDQRANVGIGAFSEGPAHWNHTLEWAGPRVNPLKLNGTVCKTWFRPVTPLKVAVQIKVVLGFHWIGQVESHGGKLIGSW